MHKFKTTAGHVVDVNETSYEFAKELGWEEVKDEPKPKPTKGRKSGNRTDSN